MLLAALDHAGFFTLWRPEALLFIILLAVIYRQVTGPLRSRFGEAPPPTRGQRRAFNLGLLALYLALGSPLQYLGDDYLFSAHMVQFVLVSLFAAPLLIVGLPGWLVDLALSRPVFFTIARFVVRPGFTLIFFTLITVFQVPFLLEKSLAVNGLFIAEQYLILLASIVLWWPVFSPSAYLPALSRPLALLYIFLMSIPTAVSFALITLSSRPFFPTYAHATRLLGLNPLADQQLGGIIMKVSTMAVLGGVFIAVFVRWWREEQIKERTTRLGPVPASAPRRPAHLTVVRPPEVPKKHLGE